MQLLRRSRDFWWNSDFLQLMANRWLISADAKVLDVGCGRGHWGRSLAHVLRPSRMVFLDRDNSGFADLADLNETAFKNSGLEWELIRSNAESIPLASNNFDLVTCQTLLMHVSRPEQVLAEMVRVCKPGGTIVCVEPSDLANCAILSPLFLDQPLSTITRHLHFWATYALGRKTLNLGDVNVGERLPALYKQMNLRNVRVHISDKALFLVPPYEGEEQQTLFEEELKAVSGSHGSWQGIWRGGEVRKCFLAGGGTELAFEEYLRDIESRLSLITEELVSSSYTKTGGRVLYLVSGLKPND